MYIKKSEMKAYEYIKKTREYLNYLEDHINNVRKAFQEVAEACKDMWWVKEDYSFHELREDVCYHDLSKFSQQEFVPYREEFFPIKNEVGWFFSEAQEHHKHCNTHHYESVEIDLDVIHMIIDWTAMGYKFNNTAQEYYEKNKDKINLSYYHKKLMLEIFDRLKKCKKIKKKRGKKL